MTRFVSCDRETILRAVDAAMACVPKPWTLVMIEDAVDAVSSIADEWRHLTAHEIETDDVVGAFLDSRIEDHGSLLLQQENERLLQSKDLAA